jgi:hypothetical protein
MLLLKEATSRTSRAPGRGWRRTWPAASRPPPVLHLFSHVERSPVMLMYVSNVHLCFGYSRTMCQVSCVMLRNRSRFCTCCKCVIWMLQVCYLNVAFFIERFECFNQHDTYIAADYHLIFRWMIINIFNIFLMLQILIFDVARC